MSFTRTVRSQVFEVGSRNWRSFSKMDWLPYTYRPPYVLVMTQSTPKSGVAVVPWPVTAKVLMPVLKPQNHELSKSRFAYACALADATIVATSAKATALCFSMKASPK